MHVTHNSQKHSTAWTAHVNIELRCVPHQETSFAGSESCIVCNIAHQLVPVDIVEAVADGNTLLQAVRPLHSVLLQLPYLAANHRQYAIQIWLHTMQQREGQLLQHSDEADVLNSSW